MEEEWTGDSNAAVEEVLNRYPEAREFLPLISASTVEEFEAVARDLASRVKNIQAKNSNTDPSSSPRTPKPAKDIDKAMSVEEAIKAKSFPDYLHAKWEAAGRG